MGVSKAPEGSQSSRSGSWEGLVLDLLIWVGSLFVLGSAIIHFHLWDSFAYRALRIIGPLFLMQAIAGAVLAILTSVSRKLLLVLAECGFAFASAGGLIISINFGLFGWKDTLSAPYAGLALAVEFSAGALLLVASAVMGRRWLAQRTRHRPASQTTKPVVEGQSGDGAGPNRPRGSRPAAHA